MRYKQLLEKLIRSFNYIIKAVFQIIDTGVESSVYCSLLKNASMGMFNSQCFLAQYYLEKRKDYVEAYAWAEVSYRRGHPDALAIKKAAENLLEPEKLKEAWELARIYKNTFLPSQMKIRRGG